jgi:hypothetical protein
MLEAETTDTCDDGTTAITDDGTWFGTLDQATTTTEVSLDTATTELAANEVTSETGTTTGEFHELGTVNQKPVSTSKVGVEVIYANVG